MEIDVFKRRPYSAMVDVSQDEAWRIIRSLVDQMQKNDPNTERVEMHDAHSQYFSIAVKPDPIRSLTGTDRMHLTSGFAILIQQLRGIKDKEFVEMWDSALGRGLEATLNKISKIPLEE